MDSCTLPLLLPLPLLLLLVPSPLRRDAAAYAKHVEASAH
jgi:hypothetical protein